MYINVYQLNIGGEENYTLQTLYLKMLKVIFPMVNNRENGYLTRNQKPSMDVYQGIYLFYYGQIYNAFFSDKHLLIKKACYYTMVFLCKLDVYNLNFSMNTFLPCVPSCFRKGQTKFINPNPLTHVTRIRETQQQDSLLIERHTSFLQTFHVVLTNQ